jgi:hypothetical protein
VELVDDEDPVEELGGGCCPERLGEGVRRWRPDQSLDDLPEARASASYADLVDRVESRGRQRKPNGTIRTDFARSAAAPPRARSWMWSISRMASPRRLSSAGIPVWRRHREPPVP